MISSLYHHDINIRKHIKMKIGNNYVLIYGKSYQKLDHRELTHLVRNILGYDDVETMFLDTF